MATAEVILIGPAHGGARGPRCRSYAAGLVDEALALAGHDAGIAVCGKAPGRRPAGVVVFLNGHDLHTSPTPNPPLHDGDVLTVICPATDT